MSKDKPSVVLMGSKPGSVIALSILLKRKWRVKYVVVSEKATHPWVSGPSLKEYAISKGIKVVTQATLPRTENFDFVISYMFRYKVKPDVIALGKRAALNFHPGPLPGFGGWAFYNMAILENSAEYGCTCHYMDNDFDKGPVLKVSHFSIEALRETAVSLERKTQEDMIRLFIEFCDIAESGAELPKEEQDKNKIRYLDYEQFIKFKEIPPDADRETIDRYARAFWYPPYECAYIKYNGIKVEIIPDIAKEYTAFSLHKDDFEGLQKVSKIRI